MAEAYTLIEHAPLAARNTLRVAATARWLATVNSAAALPALLDLPAARGPVMVLGEGSNLLFAGDYPGLLLQPAFAGVGIVADAGGTAVVRAEAATRSVFSAASGACSISVYASAMGGSALALSRAGRARRGGRPGR